MIQINGIYCLEGDSYITNDIRRTGTLKWDPTFERILQHIGAGNGRTMVDVGAYIGDSTKWFEDAGFKCHAFEPMFDAFECLEKNVHPDTEVYQLAVGNENCYDATILQTEGNLGGRSITLGGPTPTISLDRLFRNGIDVLKIDAEGFEPFILEGAKETLKKKPILIIEINEEALGRFGFTADDVFKYLDDYEFEEVYRYDEGQYDLICKPKRKVFVSTGRFGDLYQICQAATEPCIIFTSQEFSGIVRELFPQHQVFTVAKTMSGIVEMMELAKTRFPSHTVMPAQQNGMPLGIVGTFRNYEEFQRFQVNPTARQHPSFQPTSFSKAVVYLDGISSGIYGPMYANIKRNVIQGIRAMGLEVIEYQNKNEGFQKLREDFNQPDTLYVVNDSLSYHLCDNAPVIIISRAIQWAQSTPKANCIGRLTHEMIEQDYSELVAVIGRNKPMRRFYDHIAATTYIAYSEYTPNNMEVLGRHSMALSSWTKLNSVDYNVALVPFESEGLPFVGDIAKEALANCNHPDDIIILTNRDIALVPESVGIIRAFMDSRNIDECYIHRVDIAFKNHLSFNDLKGLQHNWGIDVFVFRPSSEALKKLLRTPLYIGRTDWDNYWASVVKHRLPYSVAYHAPHEELWKTEDGIIGKQNRHNQTKIMEAMPELSLYDRVGYSGLGPIS